MTTAETEPESAIRELCEREHWQDAATAILDRYGRELLEYLVAIARSETDGAEAFSQFTEDLWRGLPRFRWESSTRTWCYTLARHALSRVRREPHRKLERGVALSDAPEVARLAQHVRSTTVVYLRTAVKNEVAALREELSPDDQSLLILRLDRRLSWLDVARALADEGEELSADELRRRSATLRKRFGRIKSDLKALVERYRPRT